MLRQLGLSLFLLALLSSCAQRIEPPQRVTASVQQLGLDEWQKWRVKGRLAFKSPEQKFSANLNWRQNLSQFDIRLSSFVGTTLMNMSSRPGLAKLEFDDNEYQDIDASYLIWRTTGWNIPVSKLPNWLKGAAEGTKIDLQPNGLVASFVAECPGCEPWLINYGKYKLVNNVWLPHSINLTNQLKKDNQIKIRVNQWQKL